MYSLLRNVANRATYGKHSYDSHTGVGEAAAPSLHADSIAIKLSVDSANKTDRYNNNEHEPCDVQSVTVPCICAARVIHSEESARSWALLDPVQTIVRLIARLR